MLEFIITLFNTKIFKLLMVGRDMEKIGIERVGKDGWVFVWPRGEEREKASDIFFEGLEYLDVGENGKARKLFEKALEIFPEHIDVLHHLAIISSKAKSKELIGFAMKIGSEVISGKLKEGDKLEWGWTENRPFLRAYHFKGLNLLDAGKIEEATKIFKQIILWNPNDNQGVRSILADIYAKGKRWDELLLLCEKYQGDSDPSISYGYVLGLFKKGEKERATEQLKKCMWNLPLCGKILLKKNPKKPKPGMQGYVTYADEDLAYEFWEGQKEAWQDEDVLKWLGRNIGKKAR